MDSIDIVVNEMYSWKRDGVSTKIWNSNGECLWIEQESAGKTHYLFADWRMWRLLLTIALQWMRKECEYFPAEVRDWKEYFICNQPSEAMDPHRLLSFFDNEPVCAKKGEKIFPPKLFTPNERLYSVYILEHRLCFGINATYKFENETRTRRAPDVYVGKKSNPNHTWISFEPEDAPHLMRAIYANYCKYRPEVKDIMGFFTGILRS